MQHGSGLARPACGRLGKAWWAVGWLGLTLWCALRVAQKPSRASYPCVRASFPLISVGFYQLLGVPGAALLVRLARSTSEPHRRARLPRASLAAALVVGVALSPECGRTPADSAFQALVAGAAAGNWQSAGTGGEARGGASVADGTQEEGSAGSSQPEPSQGGGGGAGQPGSSVLGRGVGVFPGRVVWVHDADATNEKTTNQPGDGYFLPQNSDQRVIDRMLAEGVQRLAGSADSAAACPALFVAFNREHGKGESSYRAGEKVFLKINATSGWGYGQADGNLDADFNIVANASYGISETSPAAVLTMLRWLTGSCGIAQSEITVGDPMNDLYAHALALWQGEFPQVTYLSAHAGPGRTQAKPGSSPVIFYSDRGLALRTGDWTSPVMGSPVLDDKLFSIYEEVDYVVNLAAFKAHSRAGVTLCAKNHFGSTTRGSALHLHMGLVNPAGFEASAVVRPNLQGYGLYRVQVDFMGHRLLGGKTVLYALDGLWGAGDATDPPVRFSSDPFGGDFSSSLFFSQDPVAIESVAYDILKEEFTEQRHPGRSYPQMAGVDDYLHQAADARAWPEGITYDPENDGTPLGSLGVHEHWIAATDRRYSRDLGSPEGIELVFVSR